MIGDLRRTPLHGWHVEQNARMADFAGWSMPIQYSTIREEHLATRGSVTLFDVSHMARFRFEGAESQAFLDSLVTRNVANMRPGEIRYSLATNASGGVLDDLLVYCISSDSGEPYYGIVANASNRQKLLDWIRPRLNGRSVALVDETEASAMIAVQGPHALTLLGRICPGTDLAPMKYYWNFTTKVAEASALISRTGYTGEDGFEIVIGAEHAQLIWESLLRSGADLGVRAAGLGARDTLRLEAGMPLYGHELSESINPLQAGLRFAVNVEGRDFPGRDALAAFDKDAQQKLIGLKLEGKRVPRENYKVFNSQEQEIGYVSSGTYSPTLEIPIAMSFVQPNFAHLDTRLLVDIRGKRAPALVSKLPFYRRKKG